MSKPHINKEHGISSECSDEEGSSFDDMRAQDLDFQIESGNCGTISESSSYHFNTRGSTDPEMVSKPYTGTKSKQGNNVQTVLMEECEKGSIEESDQKTEGETVTNFQNDQMTHFKEDMVRDEYIPSSPSRRKRRRTSDGLDSSLSFNVGGGGGNMSNLSKISPFFEEEDDPSHHQESMNFEDNDLNISHYEGLSLYNTDMIQDSSPTHDGDSNSSFYNNKKMIPKNINVEEESEYQNQPSESPIRSKKKKNKYSLVSDRWDSSKARFESSPTLPTSSSSINHQFDCQPPHTSSSSSTSSHISPPDHNASESNQTDEMINPNTNSSSNTCSGAKKVKKCRRSKTRSKKAKKMRRQQTISSNNEDEEEMEYHPEPSRNNCTCLKMEEEEKDEDMDEEYQRRLLGLHNRDCPIHGPNHPNSQDIRDPDPTSEKRMVESTEEEVLNRLHHGDFRDFDDGKEYTPTDEENQKIEDFINELNNPPDYPIRQPDIQPTRRSQRKCVTDKNMDRANLNSYEGAKICFPDYFKLVEGWRD